MARCNTCFKETPIFWHRPHRHFCSMECVQRFFGIETIDLMSLLKSAESSESPEPFEVSEEIEEEYEE